jgi:hypothetical protein
MSRRLLILALALLTVVLATVPAGARTTQSSLWSDLSSSAVTPAGDRVVQPDLYRPLALDVDAMREVLATAPLEGTPEAAARTTLELPLPYGGFGEFAIVESPILDPALGSRYPDIRTYAGIGLDDPSATVRLDLTPAGFHALVLSAEGTWLIDPVQMGDIVHYQSYYHRDHTSGPTLDGCTVIDDGMGEEIARLVRMGVPRSGTQLRTYRTAVAADGEYTIFHGGTVPLGLAAVTTSMNRVDGVYEREVSVRMVLIPNEDLIIYTNPSTDPYTNNNGNTMLGQNQANLDAVIGSANYDIGHVFSTGGGGIAGLGVVCRAGRKAQGVTGLNAPIGDNFDIDYVAHEMGHQFGSNHCFNGNAGACSGGNRNGPTAYEPGSASTIMGYAGICSPQNLQPHSDDYFVWISIQEIVAYTTGGAGNGCAVTTPTGVVEPTVDAGLGGFTIPLGTPFTLAGSATTTGTPTYCWEESDLGPAGPPDAPSGNAPIFRSFRPVTGPSRTFPKQSDLLNNVHTIGELLPTYARNLSFKLTVRDVQVGGVGVANDGIAFSVSTAGPFLVTAPNTNVTWPEGSQQTVTWNVAGTDVAPVSCANVNIRLSTDGGVSFPTVLVSNTPNDGSELVTIPAGPTTTARVKVEAADNIFFDLSNVNFTIESSAGVADLGRGASGLAIAANQPNPFNGRTTIAFEMPRSAPATLVVYDAAGRLVRTLLQGEVGAGAHHAVWDGKDESGRIAANGIYLYRLSSMGETLRGQMILVR